MDLEPLGNGLRSTSNIEADRRRQCQVLVSSLSDPYGDGTSRRASSRRPGGYREGWTSELSVP